MHRGCAHPDCNIGFDACRIHHLRWWWKHLGPTDIDNLLPLCEQHHHLVHEGRWTLTMTRERIATWHRPDGTIAYHGRCTDRRPHNAQPPPSGPAIAREASTAIAGEAIGRAARAARSAGTSGRPPPDD